MNWLPTFHTDVEGTGLNAGAGPLWLPLHDNDNMFVAGQERFAIQNDEITYQRIVGHLRFGLYGTCLRVDPPYDYKLDYGIVLVHGEYAPDGVWTNDADLPNPADSKDDPDKWLFRNTCILNVGMDYATLDASQTQGTMATCDNLFVAQPRIGWRPFTQSTDQIGPNYSHIDIKPKRKARYEEKLGIVAVLETEDPSDFPYVAFCTHNLRVLTSKWG